MEDGLGSAGLQLKYELSGRVVWLLMLKPELPKSVARTASMGRVTQDRQLVMAYLSYHVMRLVSELVAKHLLTKSIFLFLTLASFERSGLQLPLEVPTNSLKRVMDAVKQGLARLYRDGVKYRGCGVVASRISREQSATTDLFGLMQQDTRQTSLMRSVNAINRKYGNRTLSSAASCRIKPKSAGLRFRYPLITAYC